MKVDTRHSGQTCTQIDMNGAEVMQAIRMYASEHFGHQIPDGSHKLTLSRCRPVHPNDSFVLMVTHKAAIKEADRGTD